MAKSRQQKGWEAASAQQQRQLCVCVYVLAKCNNNEGRRRKFRFGCRAREMVWLQRTGHPMVALGSGSCGCWTPPEQPAKQQPTEPTHLYRWAMLSAEGSYKFSLQKLLVNLWQGNSFRFCSKKQAALLVGRLFMSWSSDPDSKLPTSSSQHPSSNSKL